MGYLDDAGRTIIRRGTVEHVYDDGSQQLVRMRGLKSEQFDKVHRPQPFGFTSTPPSGSEGLIAALGGRSDRAVMLGAEHKDHRPTNTDEGAWKLYDSSGGIISMGKKQVRIVVQDFVVVASGKIVLEGNVFLGGEGGEWVDRTDNNPSTKVKAI